MSWERNFRYSGWAFSVINRSICMEELTGGNFFPLLARSPLFAGSVIDRFYCMGFHDSFSPCEKYSQFRMDFTISFPLELCTRLNWKKYHQIWRKKNVPVYNLPYSKCYRMMSMAIHSWNSQRKIAKTTQLLHCNKSRHRMRLKPQHNRFLYWTMIMNDNDDDDVCVLHNVNKQKHKMKWNEEKTRKENIQLKKVNAFQLWIWPTIDPKKNTLQNGIKYRSTQITISNISKEKKKNK